MSHRTVKTCICSNTRLSQNCCGRLPPTALNGGGSATFSNKLTPTLYKPAAVLPAMSLCRTSNMLKCYILLFALVVSAACDDARKSKQSNDPVFSLLDRLVNLYMFPPRVKLWPWSDIFQSANPLEDPKLVLNKNKCEIDLYVKKFQPEDLRVRVKNRFVIVEGKRKESDEDSHFMVNRFVQNFALPAGCKEDEVLAVFEKGVLSISAPRHELPPPPPERDVPIEVRRPPVTETIETTTTEKEVQAQTSSATPLEQLDIVEATTHVGKIRKKDLKTTKTSKDNEVTKGDGNGLDYTVDISENE